MRTTVVAVLLAAALSAVAEGGGTPATPRRPSCDVPSQQEIDIAHTPLVYAVVDGPRREIALKARGVVLRRFPLRDLWSVGRGPSPTGPFWLVAKRPRVEPVPWMPPKPGEAPPGEAPPEPAPLTVAAMPARYQLVFEHGVSIWVRSGGASTRWQRLWQVLGGASDRLRARVTVLARSVARAREQALVVELSGEDARALYWAARPPLPLLLRGACP